MMEAASSSETSVIITATQRNIPEGSILKSKLLKVKQLSLNGQLHTYD
jgi:hypothetical protein